MAASLASRPRPRPDGTRKLDLLGRNAIPAVLLLLEAVEGAPLDPHVHDAIDRLRGLSSGLVDSVLAETGGLGEVLNAIEIIRTGIG